MSLSQKILSVLVLLAIAPSASAQNASAACPIELPALIDQLLLDLPSYANRVIQRRSLNTRPTAAEPFELRSPRSYLLIAGQPEIEAIANPSPDGAPLYQIFFTSLERQYVDQADGVAQPRAVQQFHRLVLAQVEPPEGWRVIRLRSQFGAYSPERPLLFPPLLSPPRNADQSPVAQAIRLWLRDCGHRQG